MRDFIQHLIHPTLPPEVRGEAARIETLFEEQRRDHEAAIDRADRAFRDSVRIAQDFIEKERGR